MCAIPKDARRTKYFHVSPVTCHLTTTLQLHQFGDAAAGGLMIDRINNQVKFSSLRKTLFGNNSQFHSVKRLH